MAIILKTDEGLKTCFYRTVKAINTWVESWEDLESRLMSEMIKVHNITEGNYFHSKN